MSCISVNSKVSELETDLKMPAMAKKGGAQQAGSLNRQVGERLRAMRGHASPEDIAAATNGAVSASYIRRIEKGTNSPTIDVLDAILRAMGSNLGLFFEHMIVESDNVASKTKYFHRIVQRGLDGPNSREVEATIRMIGIATQAASK